MPADSCGQMLEKVFDAIQMAGVVRLMLYGRCYTGLVRVQMLDLVRMRCACCWRLMLCDALGARCSMMSLLCDALVGRCLMLMLCDVLGGDAFW